MRSMRRPCTHDAQARRQRITSLKRFANVRCKQMGQQCHAPGMAASDWRYVNDLAGQQFDAVIFAEDRSRGHLVKLVDRKQSSRRLNGH